MSWEKVLWEISSFRKTFESIGVKDSQSKTHYEIWTSKKMTSWTTPKLRTLPRLIKKLLEVESQKLKISSCSSTFSFQRSTHYRKNLFEIDPPNPKKVAHYIPRLALIYPSTRKKVSSFSPSCDAPQTTAAEEVERERKRRNLIHKWTERNYGWKITLINYWIQRIPSRLESFTRTYRERDV